MMRVPLPGSVRSTRRRIHEYEVEDTRSDELQIVLRGVYEAGSECSVPPEKIQTIGVEGAD